MRQYYKRQTGRYADPSDAPIGDVRYPEACHSSKAEWFEQDQFVSGDYVGYGAIGRSNVRVLRRDFAELEDSAWWLVRGSHGSQCVRFAIAVETATEGELGELRAMLDGLEYYCIADDDDCSEVEQEEYCEAWDNYGASDFASALADAYVTETGDELHSVDFYRAIPKETLMLAWEALKPSGEYVIHETGGCYFPFDSLLGARAGMCKPSYAEVRTALLNAIRN